MQGTFEKKLDPAGNVEDSLENLQYFYHSDHLGSAAVISFTSGRAYQHLQYFPFGELFVSQRNSSFDSRYKFSAKELDNETGYSYFGARYYDSDLSSWLSVDPLASQFPSHSPYNFCLNNPIRLVDPDGRAPGNPSTDVKRNEDGSYTVVGAKNDGDRNIYVVGENGQRTGEVIGTTVTPFDFMFTDDKTGKFYFDKNFGEYGPLTFRMDNLTVSGTVQTNEYTTSSIYSADASDLAAWGTGMFLDELYRTSGTAYAGLIKLRSMSQNGGPLDIKASFGLHPYTPVSTGNSNMITTLRGMGNMIFGMNIAHTKPLLLGSSWYYTQVMKQVGVYNQSQNHGNGYNAGWPFYGEHTYSGTYIYFGYFGQMP